MQLTSKKGIYPGLKCLRGTIDGRPGAGNFERISDNMVSNNIYWS
jgi:hypothetical protein